MSSASDDYQSRFGPAGATLLGVMRLGSVEAYDVALRGLYDAVRRGASTTEIRQAVEKEQAAEDRLPPDTRSLVLIMADIGQGGCSCGAWVGPVGPGGPAGRDRERDHGRGRDRGRARPARRR